MLNPTTLATLVKVANLNDQTNKAIGWVILAVISPLLVIIVLLCGLLAGTANHNNTALLLSWYGGVIPESVPESYRGHIEDMRNSFAILDEKIAAVNEQIENGGNLDETRIKAIFYALYFGNETPSRWAHQQYVDCFVTYTETQTIAVPINDLQTVYQRISETFGISITVELQDNADSIYNIILYGFSGGDGSDWMEGVDVPYIGADGFCSPIGANWRSIVTSEFGYRSDPFTGQTRGHSGMDLAVPTGTPVRAALPGIITVSQYNAGGYGYYIMIDHGNGLSTLYGHNSKLLARVGQTVQAGDIISLSGSTGRSTGPHLHFEVRINGERTNPRYYLP